MNLLNIDALASTERQFLAEGKGYFPVLTTDFDGGILAVYRDGGGHGGHGGFLVSRRSEDAGASWSDEITVVNSGEYDDRNPAVGIAHDGTAVVGYFATGQYRDGCSLTTDRRNPASVHAGLVWSADGGRSWSEPMLWTDATEWDGMSPYGRILSFADGSMAMPIYWMDRSCMLWSRDNGRTWGDLTLIAQDINETAVLVLPSGEWMCMGRSQAEPNPVMLSCRWSNDCGATWSDAVPFLPGWRFPADLTLLSDGSVLASYGFREPPHGARARRSTDNGRTWSDREIVLHDQALTGDCGYPSTVLVDGWLVTAYYDAGDFENYYDPTHASCQVVRYREDELLEAFEA
jgi:hypothetical protein